MKRDVVIIIAPQVDPHADAVVNELNEKKDVKVLRLDLETAYYDHDIIYLNSGGKFSWEIICRQTKRRVVSAELTSVWWRRTHTLSPSLDNGLPTGEGIDRRECESNLRSILASLPRKTFPLGHPIDLREGENKIRQFSVAQQVGFVQPDTIFSNSRASLSSFAQKHMWIAAKSLNQSIAEVSGKEVSFATRRHKGQALAHIINDAPQGAAVLQEALDRTRDLRVVCLPNSFFAVAIDLERLPPGEIDWRAYIRQCKHTSVKLSQAEINRCRLFLKKMNLTAGHFDFVVSHDGQLIFLECNPNGQWLWLEQATGEKIAKKIAAALIQTM